MEAINVPLSNLPGNQRHCYDGDSTYLSGSLENTLARLSDVDAFEVRGMNISYLRKSKFLYRLNFELKQFLEPKLTEQSIRIHKDLRFKARDCLESVLEEELVLFFGKETFDRYGRPLVYLSVRDQDTYNLKKKRRR